VHQLKPISFSCQGYISNFRLVFPNVSFYFSFITKINKHVLIVLILVNKLIFPKRFNKKLY